MLCGHAQCDRQERRCCCVQVHAATLANPSIVSMCVASGLHCRQPRLPSSGVPQGEGLALAPYSLLACGANAPRILSPVCACEGHPTQTQAAMPGLCCVPCWLPFGFLLGRRAGEVFRVLPRELGNSIHTCGRWEVGARWRSRFLEGVLAAYFDLFGRGGGCMWVLRHSGCVTPEPARADPAAVTVLSVAQTDER